MRILLRIDAKLKDLGYTANEIHYSNVRKHSLYNQPRDLTDRIWTTIEPKLVAQLEGYRDTVRKREEAKAMKARGEALRPYYDGMHTALGAEARSLFPPFGNWLHLESVKPLYEPADAKPDDDSFQAVRAAIKAECDKFASQIQTVFWSRLVKAHSEADGQEVPKAMPVSQLKALAQRVTSAINRPNECCSTFATFPSILDHFKVCTLSALTDTSLYTSAAHVKAIRHVVAAVDAIEPERALAKSATSAALYALGGAFRCIPCQPQQSAVGPAAWSRALSLDMNWSATVRRVRIVRTNRTQSQSCMSFRGLMRAWRKTRRSCTLLRATGTRPTVPRSCTRRRSPLRTASTTRAASSWTSRRISE